MAEHPFLEFDHVQLAMQAGGEQIARRFFVDLLGMTDVVKQHELAKRGGYWFASGKVQIHLGVENDYRPARKAHLAFRCRNYESLLARLRSQGIETIEAEHMPGVRRCHIFDPFGNRIELVAD